MILCPNCHHNELPGALFCSECGARLVASETPTTQNFARGGSDILSFQVRPKPVGPRQSGALSPQSADDLSISLHMVDSGQVLQLTGQSEFSLGRVSEGQLILPDVDLSNHNAYAQGVSRLHATIKISKGRVMLTDLGSSNGTRVNGQKISPNIDFPINHGDVIALGKFKMQVLIRK